MQMIISGIYGDYPVVGVKWDLPKFFQDNGEH
jgi:hypothetical protein